MAPVSSSPTASPSGTAPSPAEPAGLRPRLRRALVAQFQRPRGLLGHAAAWVLAHRGSNVARNRWTVALLAPRPGERLLELGCGPGVALAEIAARIGSGAGEVIGLDHSATVLRHARRRNRRAVREGRVRLVQGSYASLPDLGTPAFDAVLSVNALAFADDLAAVLAPLYGLLVPRGRIAVTFQSRRPGARDADTRRGGERVAAALREAGFADVRVEILPLKPVCAVCALGRRPGPAPGRPDNQGSAEQQIPFPAAGRGRS